MIGLESSLPMVGLGTFQLKGEQCVIVVERALKMGYRLIDTARCYKNEKEVGLAIINSGIPRNELFITSKIAPTEQGENSYDCVENTLKTLGVEYVDLMLIHWPGANKRHPSSEDNKVLRRATWRGLMRSKANGLVRYIGVSNFTVEHLQDFIDICGYEKPVLNQVSLQSLTLLSNEILS